MPCFHLWVIVSKSKVIAHIPILMHPKTFLPNSHVLHILKSEARASWLRTQRGRWQIRLVFALAAILLDDCTFLTTFLDCDNLNVDALLDGLLEAGDHGADGAEFVKGEFAVEDGFLGFAVIEAALEAVDEGHRFFGFRLVDLLAEGFNVEVGVGGGDKVDIPGLND
jgi:hypothetical protein